MNLKFAHPFRLSLLAALLCGSAWAQSDFIWKGSNNNNWGNSGNWNQNPGSGDIPGEDDDVLLVSTQVNNDRYRIDLGGNARWASHLDVDWDNTNKMVNGYAFELFNNTLNLAKSATFEAEYGTTEIPFYGILNPVSTNTWKVVPDLDNNETELKLYGNLIGAGHLLWKGGDLGLYSANAFTGNLELSENDYDSGTVRRYGIKFGHTDALADARLTLTSVNGGQGFGEIRVRFGVSEAKVGMLVGNHPFGIPSGVTLSVGRPGRIGEYSGSLSNSGNLKLQDGTWTLSNGNTLSGQTTVDGGTLRLKHATALVNSPVVINAAGILNLINPSSVAAVSGQGVLLIGGHDLKIAGSSNPGAFSGWLEGTGEIEMMGGGTFQPTGTTGVFLGSMRVTNGVLKPGASRFQSAEVINNATGGVDLTANTTFGGFGGSGSLVLDFNLTFGGLNTSTNFTGILTGTGGMTKNGTGTWTFNGQHQGSGLTSVNSGTLAGTGTFLGPLTIGATASLSPTPGPTALSCSSNVDVDGALNVELNGADAGHITAGNTLFLTGASLNLTETGAGATEPVYVLCKYGSRVDTFATVTGIPPAYYLDYNYNDGSSTGNIALRKAPRVTSIVPTMGTYSDVENPVFTVTFSEAVTGFDSLNDLIIQTSSGTVSVTAATILSTASNQIFSVSLEATGDGAFTLSVPTGPGIQDLDGDPVLTTVISSEVTLRTTPIHYVSKLGSNTFPYDSWATAAEHLQDVLLLAGDGDEVRLGPGEYFPDEGGGQTPGDRAASFVLSNNLTLRGGFPGNGGGQDIENNQTILLGDVGFDDTSDFQNTDENAYHVVTMVGTHVTLDGLTIAGGNADTFQGRHLDGGGLFIREQASATIRQCRFGYNQAGANGAGVYLHKTATATFDQCLFEFNRAGYSGGGVYVGGTAGFTNCLLVANEAAFSGGGVAVDGIMQSVNAQITGNIARDGGGAALGLGASLTSVNNTFAGNVATGRGGGIVQGVDSVLVVSNSVVAGNAAAGPDPASASLYSFFPSTLTAGYSLLQHLTPAGIGNLNGSAVTPVLLFESTADVLDAPTADGDYRPGTGSVLIDAGDNSINTTAFDVDGNPRISNGGTGLIIDIGALER